MTVSFPVQSLSPAKFKNYLKITDEFPQHPNNYGLLSQLHAVHGY